MRPPRNPDLPYYGYCVLRLEAEPEWKTFPGIGGRPVFPLREARLAMLVSRVSGRAATEPESVIEHGRVIHRAFERHTVLPFRFGTLFQTEQQARQVLIANRSALQDGLNRLRGKAEMHLKLVYLSAGRETAGARPTDADISRLACQRVGGLFQPLDEHVSVRTLHTGEWLVDLAHLIDGERVDSYQRVFNAAAERMKDCQLLVTGPWPPYHFLPPAVRMPAASERRLNPGRRLPQRRAAVIPFETRAAKA